jgi:hypothetical protein
MDGLQLSGISQCLIINTATELRKMVNWQNGKDNANELAFSTNALSCCRTNIFLFGPANSRFRGHYPAKSGCCQIKKQRKRRDHRSR